MRVESILLHVLVVLVLVALWLLAGELCCHYDGDIGNICDLATVGGISSFAEISFALNTSIAIKWIRTQFMAWFDGFVEQRMIKHRIKTKTAKLTEKSVADFEKQKQVLKRRFDSMMLWPTRIYMTCGILFAIAIAAMLFSGIPLKMKPFVVLMPFPAIAYYMTALLTGGLIFIHFDSFVHDKELPGEEDTEDAESDIAMVVKGARSSVAKSRTSASSAKKNGNGRKASAK